MRDIDAFKREHGLAPEGEEDASFSDDLDLRAEDDALIAAELDAEPEEEEEDEAESEAEADKPEDGGRRRASPPAARTARRPRPQAPPKALEGSFDHGEEGYGLWLDPSIQEDSVYAEHWAGHRPVTVSVEPDRIVIRRAGEDTPGDNGDSGSDELDPDEFAA